MMNNLDKIIAKIQEDADRKIAEIEADRDREIDALNRRAEEILADRKYKAQIQAKKDADAILSRANAAASMKRREILLRKKDALLDEVYRRAEETIFGLPADEYVAFLAKLTADAVAERVENVRSLTELYGEEESAAEPVSEFSVILSSADKEKYGKAVLKAARAMLNTRVKNPPALVLAQDCAKIPGGTVVRYGDMETCCSIPAMLAGIREKTDPQIAALLFG